MYVGANGQHVTIVANPNLTSYTVGDIVLLTCMVDSLVDTTNSTVTYSWHCSDCYANGRTTQSIAQQLTDMDSSMITCSVTANGVVYNSNMFNLQVTRGNFIIITFYYHCM